MLGSLVYNSPKGVLKYAFAMSSRFGGFRLYLKPADLQSALFAENIEAESYPNLITSFEEDFSYCRYRLDMESSLRLSTTVSNTTLANTIAAAIQGASFLTKREYGRKSTGEFRSVWDLAVEGTQIASHIAFKLGMLSTGVINTFTPDNQPSMSISFYDEGVDTASLHSRDYAIANNLPVDSTNVFVMSPQMAILQREAEKSPLFNTLTRDAKKLYTLASHYADLDERLKQVLPKRNGYYFFSISKTDAYPGAEYLTAKVAKSDVNLGVYQTIEDVREAHPDKNTAWIEDCQYEIVTDEMLPKVMEELWAAPILSFDTETTGLKINFYSREGLADELVGVCISAKPGTGYYFPLQHKLFANLCGGDHHHFMQTYMKELLETKPLVCHNLSFDWKVGYIYDINLNCVFDTLLAFGVTKRYEYLDFPLGLKELCSLLFGIDMFEIEDFVISDWSKTAITFADLPYDLVKHYGPADADITLRVYLWCLKYKLLEQYHASRVFQLEVNFAKVVAYSEFWGYHLDVEQLPALEKDIHDGMATEQAELFKLAGKEFNPNSAKQLAEIIYDELYPHLLSSGIVSKRTTAKDVLHDLRDNYRNPDGTAMYPFVEHLLEYRRYETTSKNFFKKKDLFVSEEGFVFPGVQQLGTNTGRISVKDPNYQSYNDVVKKRVTGRPGYYIFDCDFAQIEYRVLASLAGQDALIKAFDDPDLDYHTHQAARMFSVPYAAVSKQLRQQSKGINFGLPYGMGDESLGARVFGARTPENTAKAADLRRRFFAGQEKIQEFFDRARNNGVRNGYTETWLGRRRYYHKEVFSEGSIRRQAGNAVVQGCLSGDTRIQTRKYGLAKLEAMVGKTVLLWDGEAWTRGDVTYAGRKQKYVVNFSGGQSIVCSPDHKFLVVGRMGARYFVACKDLIGRAVSNNPRMVVINTKYEKSGCECADIASDASNISSSTVGDSFTAGVALGRLASQVPDNIFANTELLRGFLRGLFDSNGDISDGAICLTFGADYDFELMCKDIQKALLFFGIRSSYSEYEGQQYVVQISVDDSKRFSEIIGFTDPEKQLQAETMCIPHDNPAFGSPLTVESVLMTNEYIDMYDVCNTERGCFVADGIVTHNSAADIWKLAVTRFFNRIVKEGLLGKVFFNCFVHDELMGEVSVDVDPYEFIKMWREEYELSIENFCRLYAGFGWGNSWYEAKKADYPPQFIDTLVAKAGKGIPWNGDYRTLIKQTKQDLYDFETKRVVDWLQSVPKGTLLAPHIGGYLYDKVNDWWGDIVKANPEADNYLLKSKKGVNKPVASLDQVISWFCQHEGVEYKPGWVLPADSQTASISSNTGNQQVVEQDEAAEMQAQYNQLVCQQVYDLGFYLDTTAMTLYIKFIDNNKLQAFCSAVCSPYIDGSLKVIAVAFDAQGMAQAYDLNIGLSLLNFNVAQELIRTMYAG